MSAMSWMTLRRAWAAVMALAAIATAVASPTRPNVTLMSGMLLLCWHMAFVPAPPLRTPLRDVYAQARMGQFRTSTTAKLVNIAGMVLVAAGIYGNMMAGW